MLLEDGVRWAGWSPVDPDTFAYANGRGALPVDPGGGTGHAPGRPTDGKPLCEVCWDEGPWQVGHWLGWSPNGRWMWASAGTPARSQRSTRRQARLLVPLVSEEGRWIDEPRWWR